MTETEQYGLKEDWQPVEDTLVKIIPVYDKTNRYISLGSDLRIRELGLEWLRQELKDELQPIILDIGCGTGKMGHMLDLPVIQIDPLLPMIQMASRLNRQSQSAISIFENLPIRSSSVDAVMTGFAIRDARNLVKAISEISSVLKEGSYFLIVDLSKPDSRTRRALIALYWSAFAPLIAFLSAGRLGLKFVALSKTYKRLPTNSEFLKIANRFNLSISKSKYFMLGGASVLLLQKSLPKSGVSDLRD